MDKKNKQSLDYWKKYMEENAEKNSLCNIDIEKEELVNPQDPFGIGFDPKEDMTFLPKIPK